MIVWIFIGIFVVSGLLAFISLRDLKLPKHQGKTIQRKQRLFGVINLKN